MAVNTSPIFSKAGQINWNTTAITTAVTSYSNNTGATLVYTASADGSYVQKIKFKHLGANTATVARVWINNGGALGDLTGGNNILFDEITIPTNSAASQIAALNGYELPLNFALPANYKIYVTIGTTIASGLAISVIGGTYTS